MPRTAPPVDADEEILHTGEFELVDDDGEAEAPARASGRGGAGWRREGGGGK